MIGDILFFFLSAGCGSFITMGVSVYQTYSSITTSTIRMLLLVFLMQLPIEMVVFQLYSILKFFKYTGKRHLCLYLFVGVGYYLCFQVVLSALLPKLYTEHDINTLNITSLNCTELSYVSNISCTSLVYNMTYKNGVNCSVHCHTVPNITSYYDTHGTLVVESERLDLSQIVSCHLLGLHFICAHCFINCIIPYFKTTLHKFAEEHTKEYYCILNIIIYYIYLLPMFFIICILHIVVYDFE